MGKISIIATLALTLATLTQASILNDAFTPLAAAPSSLDEQHIKYYMACARGGLNGFY
jgi:hypothetical protein